MGKSKSFALFSVKTHPNFNANAPLLGVNTGTNQQFYGLLDDNFIAKSSSQPCNDKV